jgi:zinc-finger-containing domain
MSSRPVEVSCPYCGGDAVLANSAEIYGGRDYGKIWICRPCQAWVGVHGNSPRYFPLGRLANAELRNLKMAAHAAFDPFWKSRPKEERSTARTLAYRWLAARMGLSVSATHIGQFDEAQCRQVVALCRAASSDPEFPF